jgi:hypothetical protein
LISLVEISWMLMPSSASAWNIRVATPAWSRMPSPTIETFAISGSPSTASAPSSRQVFCVSSSERA